MGNSTWRLLFTSTCHPPPWYTQVSHTTKIRWSAWSSERLIAKKHLQRTLEKFVALLPEEDKTKVRSHLTFSDPSTDLRSIQHHILLLAGAVTPFR